MVASAGLVLGVADVASAAPTLSIGDASIAEGTGAGTTTISFPLTTSAPQPVECGFRAVVTTSPAGGTASDADFVSIVFFDVTAVFDTDDTVLNRTFDIPDGTVAARLFWLQAICVDAAGQPTLTGPAHVLSLE